MLAKLVRDARGVAGMEVVLIAPILILLTMGIADFALAYWYKGILASSVSGGATYAVLKGRTVTAAAIQNIVSRQLSLPAGSVTVTGPSCYCVSGTPAAATVQACSNTCPDSTTPSRYVTISAQYTYTPILPTYSQLVSPVLRESTMARLD